MPKLTAVPKTEPPPAEKVRQRIKRMPRPATQLQCRCGSRDFTPFLSGPHMIEGKVSGGTKRLSCLHCKAVVL